MASPRRSRTSFLDINMDGIPEIANKLEKLPQNVMPKVVASTLNDLAFDSKGFKGRIGTIEIATRKAAKYDRANKSFYRKITAIDKADKKGSIKNQEAETGISRRTPRLNKTAEGLGRFNSGGGKSKSFNPVDDNRVGKSRSKLMGGSGKNRVSGRKAQHEVVGKSPSNFIRYKKGDKKNKYVAAAIAAKQQNKFLLIENAPNRGLLVKVTHVNVDEIGWGTDEKPNINTVVYGYYHQGRVVRTAPHRYINESAENTMKKSKKFFEANAKFRMKQMGWK